MKKFFYASMILALSGCASSLPVVNTANGTKKVVTYSSDKPYAVERAYAIANKTCLRQKKEATIKNEEVKYQGILEEDTMRATKTVRDVIWTAGKEEVARTVDSISGNDDYEVTVEFTCE